MPKNILFW